MKAAKAQQQEAEAEQQQEQQQQQGEGGTGDFAARMRDQVQAKRRALGKESADGREGGEGAGAKRGGGEEGEEDEEGGSESDGDASEGARKRQRVGPKGKHSAAVVAPSKQIKVADSELLTDWERKRQASGASTSAPAGAGRSATARVTGHCAPAARARRSTSSASGWAAIARRPQCPS